MRATRKSFKQGSLWLLPLMLGGCAAAIPLIPVVLPLSAALAVYAVVAGVPTLNSGVLTVPQNDIVDLVGRGTLEINPNAISLRSTSAGGSKIDTTAEQAVSCADACAQAGLSSDTCADVCDQNQIEITVWVADPADVGTVCTGGDRDMYGPYLVTLDESGNGVAVSPSAVTLTARTIQLMRTGQLATCIRVVAPDDGEVLVDDVTVNVGL